MHFIKQRILAVILALLGTADYWFGFLEEVFPQSMIARFRLAMVLLTIVVTLRPPRAGTGYLIKKKRNVQR